MTPNLLWLRFRDGTSSVAQLWMLPSDLNTSVLRGCNLDRFLAEGQSFLSVATSSNFCSATTFCRLPGIFKMLRCCQFCCRCVLAYLATTHGQTGHNTSEHSPTRAMTFALKNDPSLQLVWFHSCLHRGQGRRCWQTLAQAGFSTCSALILILLCVYTSLPL